MDRGTVARIEEWETAPCAGGYDGLRDLAEGDFSGAVSAGGAWLFMLNGRVIGVPDGTLDAFEGADGTAYRAPHPSLPLLFAMQERGGETRAKYYTDDTPLAEVDRTLSDGGFTGYVELSENVLSGDYYLLYYGGQSMSAAFIGSEERLLTGDEAFERANDEVGIYEVRTVELDVREVPEPTGTAAGAGATDDAGTGGASADQDRSADPSSEAGDSEADRPAGDVGGAQSEPGAGATDSDSLPAEEGSAASEPQDGTGERVASSSAEASAEDAEPPERRSDADPDTSRSDPASAESSAQAPADTESQGPRTPDDEDPFSEEEEWREARTIPALDPEESADPGDARTQERDRGDASEPARDGEQAEPQAGAHAERVRELRAAIESAEERIADLEARLEEATGERDDLREERDRLKRRVRELESGATSEGEAAVEEHLAPEEALAGTDVFVRYGSKGQATLDTARDGDADREAVNENLRLETHTRFEEDSVAVDDRPFDAFLSDTLEHRFVRWLVEDLLYEIRDTGTVGGLRDLYDALPRIDRIEFHGSITTRDADGEERSEPFDVILRDRMGSPLIVADLNDARDPATSEMMSDLVERATAIADEQESLSGVFMVTASFFEPDALETASDATDAGLLNRDARKSFVKLSRKRGYHLCLVEARGDEFHVAVPEL